MITIYKCLDFRDISTHWCLLNLYINPHARFVFNLVTQMLHVWVRAVLPESAVRVANTFRIGGGGGNEGKQNNFGKANSMFFYNIKVTVLYCKLLLLESTK